MWPQLPRAATNSEVHEQNQHELRQLDRTGLSQLDHFEIFSSFLCIGGQQGCSYALPMEPGLHYQVSSARAPPSHAPQGQHEAVSAPGGLHLLEEWKTMSSKLKSSLVGGASSLKVSSDLKLDATQSPPASFRHPPGCFLPSARALTHPCHYLFT